MGMTGKTLIIIPTVGKDENNLYYEKYLQKLVTSIEENTDEEYEIFLAINDYVSFSYAVNLGFREMLNRDFTGCVLLNDDMELKTKGWLTKFTEKSEKEIGIVSQASQYNDYYCGMGCCYLPREVVSKVGFLDEQFRIGEWEDIDYCFRLQEAGYKVSTIGEDVAEHGDSPTRMNAPAWAKEEIKKNKERFRIKWQGTEWLKKVGL